MSSNDASRSSAKDVLKTTLRIAEKALDGLPIPGARGTIGVLLEIISGLEVGCQLGYNFIPNLHSIIGRKRCAIRKA